MKIFAYIAQSLDGFIAKSDGNLDWLNHDSHGENYGFDDFMENIDVLLMGSNTFRLIMEFDEWYYGDKKVIVLSNRLKMNDVPDKLKGKIEISNLSPKEIVTDLENKYKNGIYVDGGKLIQSFLKDELIDELIITQIPILLGEGIHLFGNLNKEIKLELINTQDFISGLVQLTYKVLR